MKEWKGFEIVPCGYLREDKKLLDFQQYAVYKILRNDSYLLGVSTGGGKTFISLASYFYYKEKYPKTKLIIVTNKSALFQFDSEIDKFFNSDIKRVIVHAEADSKYKEFRFNTYKDFENGLDCFLINYQTFAKDVALISNSIVRYKKKDSENKVFVVYDEATAFKNNKTRNYISVSNLNLRVDKILAMTATASKGKLEEIYNILNAIKIPVYSSLAKFTREHCIMKSPYANGRRYIPPVVVGYKNIGCFKEKIKDKTLILTKTDIFDSLPAFTTKLTQVEVDVEQKKYLKEIQLSEIDGIVKLGHTRRTLLDPTIVDVNGFEDKEYISPKTLEILRLLEEEYDSEKVIVYSHSKRYINLLEQQILKNCSNKNYKRIIKITGEVSSKDREVGRKNFEESINHNLLLLNTAGIESLNLQISNTIIVCDMPSTAGNLIQLLGRVSRIGSKHTNLYVNYLMSKNTQDISEYYIIMKQALLLKSILGEAEKNIIDYDILKKQDIFPGMDDFDMETMSLDKILMTRMKIKSN